MKITTARTVLLLLAAMLLGAGIAGGIGRFHASSTIPSGAVAWHGSVLVLGTFGTLILLVRSVSNEAKWLLIGPALSAGAAVLALCSTSAYVVGTLFLLSGASLLLAIELNVRKTRRTFAALHMQAGALAWIVAAAMILTSSSAITLLPWLSAFLIFSILGERMNLGKVAFKKHASRDAHLLLIFALVSLVIVVLSPPFSHTLFGVSMVGYGLWMLRMDASRRMRQTATARFMSSGVIIAFLWLIVSGIIWIANTLWGVLFDARIHVLMLGFVVGMVMAHAPTILGTITKLRLSHRRSFYLPLGLLHVGVCLRLFGDLLNRRMLVRGGADLTSCALIIFVLVTFYCLLRARARSQNELRQNASA